MKRFLFLILSFILLPFAFSEAAEQARGFGPVVGAASTDKIVSALNSHATQRSYAFWANLHGGGSSGFGGHIFNKNNVEIFNYGSGTPEFTYARKWTGSAISYWYVTPPALDTWHHYVVTYDSSNVVNDPIFYVDGVSVTPTQGGTFPSGSPATNTDGYTIGNSTAGGDDWNGMISQFAVWNRILTPTEAANLGKGAGAYNGWAPSCYSTSLIEYIKMNDNPVTSSLLANPTVTGTLQVTGLDIDYACSAPPALSVTITSPTSSPTYDNGSTSTINLGGTATSASAITWANDRGGSGSATGTSTWTISGIALSSGSNVITVTADGSATDAITVTYTPAAPATLIGHRQIK